MALAEAHPELRPFMALPRFPGACTRSCALMCVCACHVCVCRAQVCVCSVCLHFIFLRSCTSRPQQWEARRCVRVHVWPNSLQPSLPAAMESKVLLRQTPRRHMPCQACVHTPAHGPPHTPSDVFNYTSWEGMRQLTSMLLEAPLCTPDSTPAPRTTPPQAAAPCSTTPAGRARGS